MPDQPLHPEARAFVALGFDAAWSTGLWAASWSKSLEGLTPEQAAWSPGAGRHSIWQQVLHMVFWRENVLRRLETGERYTEEEIEALNWPEIAEVTQEAWEEAKARFRDTQRRVLAGLRSAEPKYDVLTSFLPHDCYHFGMINAIRATLGLRAIE
ncbi:MAG: DinB family protein [Phycisphaerales bacterium]|nr:DinB family protein [Phycisphaerales bacterium]